MPASAFSQAVAMAESAAAGIQAGESEALAASLPQVDWPPAGLPHRLAPAQPAPTAVEADEAPAMEGGRGEGAPPSVEPTDITGALPAVQVSASVQEPAAAEEEESSWWDWLLGAVRSFLSRLPTSDPNLSTSAGERPTVDLSGDADPERMTTFEAASDTTVQDARAGADAAVLEDFGENDIYPVITPEILAPSYEPGAPPTLDGGGAPAGAPALPAEALAAFNQNAAPLLDQKVAEQVASYQAQKRASERQSEAARLDAEAQVAAETERARAEQDGMREQARGEVDGYRRSWQEENQKLQDDFNTQSEVRRHEVDQQIEQQTSATNEQVETEMRRAEGEAEKERRRAEAEAEAKKREAESQPKSFWDSVKGGISAVFEGIEQAVNLVFDGLRWLVRNILEAAKQFVLGLIEVARMAIVGLIQLFGEFLKGLVTVLLFAFPETAARWRQAIDGAVSTTTEWVNTAAAELKKFCVFIYDGLAKALDFALSILHSQFLLILDALEFLAKAMFKIMKLLAQLYELQAKIGPMIRRLQALIEDPTPVIEEIKAYIGSLLQGAPGAALSAARAAITFSEPPKNHWEGILAHLQPKLDYLAANWWSVLKETAWTLLWPFGKDAKGERPFFKDLEEIWKLMTSEIPGHIWERRFSKAIDGFLRIEQLWMQVLGMLYGWVFIGLVIGGGILGAEAGVLPGMAAGAALAGELGQGLLAATVAVELAILAKSGYDLVFTQGSPEENERDYESIASSSLLLGITGALYLLGVIAARLGKLIISRVAGRVWRRPALRGRGATARGDVIELRVASSEQVAALLRGRRVTWLEAIRKNFPVIDLLEGGEITITPRPGRRAPLYRVTGGRLISVKSTSQIGRAAQEAIIEWIDELGGFTTVRNVTVSNPSGRTLIVAVENELDDAVVNALRNHARSRGVTLDLTTHLPPNHPAVIFLDQIPAVLGEAGVVGGGRGTGEGEEGTPAGE